jgi:hypothetical protein
MFDLNATKKWVSATLADPNSAADAYKAQGAGWQQSFLQLTLPLYVGAYGLAAIISQFTGSSYLTASVGLWLFSLIWGLAWTFVIAFIFDFLAGTFEGQRSFDNAYAVVALAIIPAALGTVASPVPWVGWLISFAASIYSLVLAYRFIPKFLGIAETSRIKHFALSIVVAILVNFVVVLGAGGLFAPTMLQDSAPSVTDRDQL